MAKDMTQLEENTDQITGTSDSFFGVHGYVKLILSWFL